MIAIYFLMAKKLLNLRPKIKVHDYNAIAVNDIDIHKYLMEKNGIV